MALTPLSDPLSREQAAHLLRRATFGPTREEIESFAGKTVTEAMSLLMDDSASDPSPPIDTTTGTTWVDPATVAHAHPERDQEELFGFFQCWHMDVMRQAPLTLKERITWFFHTHLPARWTEILSSEAIYYQNALFRHYAYGSFKELFKKICVDNAMLRYLDGYSNSYGKPNENFAREMFELYSIGKGKQLEEGDYTNYTEDDIREATKVLTGWMIDDTFSFLDADTGLPIGTMRSSVEGEGEEAVEVAIKHDPEVKTFSSKFGGRSIQPAETVGGYSTVDSAYGELDEMIEMIFEQKETARFIARKLYRFFAYHFISEEVEGNVIEQLAGNLVANDYDISVAVTELLSSQHFYDLDDALKENDNMGALIKSPVDLFCGLFRTFKVEFPDRETDPAAFYTNMGYVVDRLVDQGLNFYEPFEVAGYPAYHQIPGYNRNWITTYALAHRYQTGDLLMEPPGGDDGLSIYLDVVDWLENSGDVSDPSDAVEIMSVLTTNLLAVSLTQERIDYFIYTVFLDYPEDQAYARNLWSQEWSAYQNSADDETVRLLLERLVSALIQTPEFQLY